MGLFFEEKPNGKVTLHVVPVALVLVLALALMKLVGAISLSWFWIAVVGLAPLWLFAVVLAFFMGWMALAFVVTFVLNRGKIKWTVTIKEKGDGDAPVSK
jgi:uncharacterized membrane protein